MKSWKTTIGGLLSGGGLLFAQFFPQYASAGNFVAAFGSLILGMAARDNNVTSEQACAGCANQPGEDKRQGKLLCVVGLCGLMAFAGCTNPRAPAFYALSDVKTVVDKAERHYGREVALGRVSESKQKDVDEKIVKFHAAFKSAVIAARADYTTPASPDLQRLADSLVSLIYTFASEPSP